jgi:hypothetical protein
MPRKKEDEILFVRFERKAVYNKARAEGEVTLNNNNEVVEKLTIVGSGVAEYDNIDYIFIQIPGDKDCQNHRPATYCQGSHKLAELRKKDVEEQLRIFSRPCKAPANGKSDDCDIHRFPDEWARYLAGLAEQMDGTPLKTWAALDPATIEELHYYKVFTVEQLANLSDTNAKKFFQLREQAQKYLDNAKKGAPSLQMRSELDALERQNKALLERLTALEGAKGKLEDTGTPYKPVARK